MTTRAEYQEQQRKSRNSVGRHATRTQRRKPFAGVDGEGGDVNGRHEYLLLRAGEYVLETGHPLTTAECLRFLCDLPKTFLWVSFFFDYDVTMILRDLPEERLKRVLDTDCRRIPGKPCSSFPVDWGPFQIDYMPRKEFRVRRRIGDKYGPWTIVSDTGTFFQTSFVNALEAWFGKYLVDGDVKRWVPENNRIGLVLARIAYGKTRRGGFTTVDDEERAYNYDECIMLACLMERYRAVCERQNVRPLKWQGPGNVVSSVLKREGIPRNVELDVWEKHPDVVRMANAGYYGGRFECGLYGPIEGPVYQYDINSAYPNTYASLPCLVHGEWRPVDHMPKTGIFVGHVRFIHPRGKYWYGLLPIRSKRDGVLLFPEQGVGTYWSPELSVAREYGVKCEWLEGFEYVRRCECRLFDWVRDLYHERKQLGKDHAGIVLKLVLNSIYGKLAQSVGCAPYSNPMWASLIVSHVRAQLIRAALADGDGNDVVMLATDGIFCTKPRSLPISGDLGDWSETIHPDMFAVQSGIYFIGGQKPKTRGVPMRQVQAHEADFRTTWDRFVDTGILEPVAVPIEQFIGIRLAMARGKPETAGTWVRKTKDVSFDWTSKRLGVGFDGRMFRTRPLPGSPTLASAPFDRTIGGRRIEERLEFADQPEWAQQL